MAIRRFKNSLLSYQKQYGLMSGKENNIYNAGSFVTSLQNSSYPHDHNFTQAGNKTGGNYFYGFSQETTSNFGIHYSPSPTFPVYGAIYFGDAYLNGVQIEAIRIVAHANSISTFNIQGSNNSGSGAGFCTAGTWTTIFSGNASATTEYQTFDWVPSYLDYYKAIRIEITNGELGTGGLASYYWRLGGRTRSVSYNFD